MFQFTNQPPEYLHRPEGVTEKVIFVLVILRNHEEKVIILSMKEN